MSEPNINIRRIDPEAPRRERVCIALFFGRRRLIAADYFDGTLPALQARRQGLVSRFPLAGAADLSRTNKIIDKIAPLAAQICDEFLIEDAYGMHRPQGQASPDAMIPIALVDRVLERHCNFNLLEDDRDLRYGSPPYKYHIERSEHPWGALYFEYVASQIVPLEFVVRDNWVVIYSSYGAPAFLKPRYPKAVQYSPHRRRGDDQPFGSYGFLNRATELAIAAIPGVESVDTGDIVVIFCRNDSVSHVLDAMMHLKLPDAVETECVRDAVHRAVYDGFLRFLMPDEA